jgi:hypothetical protein
MMMTRLHCFGLVLCAALCAQGCGPYSTRPEVTPDCTAGSGYDLSRVFLDSSTLAVGAAPSGFAFGDLTPGATLDQMVAVNTPAGQAVAVDPTLTCGHSPVFDMESSGHNDYGSSMFLLLNGFNGTGSQGIFFWARAVNVESNKTVTLLLADKHVDAGGGICMTAPPTAMTTDTNTVMSQTGTNANQTYNMVPSVTDCDNYFQTIVEFTNVWTLYLLPYQLFAQQQLPNRTPDGLDPSALYEFGLQIPKESHFEIWIDQIGVYQPMSAAAGP